MNARQLEVFRAIMRNGTLTAAAASLHVSQPAVSKLLRHFESQIGYRLFERIGGRLVPTAEAHLLFRDADRIFHEIESLKLFSNHIRDNRLGLLRLAASAPPTFALLPKAVERFRRRNPNVALAVQTLPAEEIGERIVRGEIDLGVTMAEFHEPRVRCSVIGHTELVVVVLASSPLAELAEVTPADLTGEVLISYDLRARVGRVLDQVFKQCGLTRHTQIEISLSIAAVPLVQRGLGVALVDGLVPWTNLGGLVVRPFRPRVSVDIVSSSNNAVPLSRFAKEFDRDLRAAIADFGTPPAAPGGA